MLSSHLAENLTILMFFVIPLVIEKSVTTHTRAEHEDPSTVLITKQNRSTKQYKNV